MRTANPQGVFLARFTLVVFGIMLAEFGLRLADALVPAVHSRLSGLKPRYVHDPLVDVRGDPALPEYDEAGFRNESRPARADIVAVGDSQTEGSGVARENAWPQQLAAAEDRVVYQLAFGSYGPGHYFALLPEALSLAPETLIVAVYTGNDLPNLYEWVYTANRSPELRAPAAAPALAEADAERGPLSQTWEVTRNARKDLGRSPVRRWLRTNVEEESKLAAVWDQIKWQWKHAGTWRETDRAPEDWATVREVVEHSEPRLMLAVERDAVRTVLTPSARLAAVDLNDARIAEALRMTARVIDEIANECRDRARLLVLLVPTKELVFADLISSGEAGVPPELEQLIAAETEVRRRLADAIRAASVQAIDALPELRATLAGGVNPYPNDSDGHPNAAGHAAIARAVSAALEQPPATP